MACAWRATVHRRPRLKNLTGCGSSTAGAPLLTFWRLPFAACDFRALVLVTLHTTEGLSLLLGIWFTGSRATDPALSHHDVYFLSV